MNILRYLMLALLAGTSFAVSAQRVEGEQAWASQSTAPQGFLLTAKHAALHIDAAPPTGAQQSALRDYNDAAISKARRLGIEVASDAGAAPLADQISWQTLADGRRLARLRVHSAGAAALRVALDLGPLPAGSSLRVAADANGREGLVELDADVLAHQLSQNPRLWTAVTAGDTQHIELMLPAGSPAQSLRIAAPAVSWLLVDPARPYERSKIGESDACEVDVRCVSNAPAGYNSVRNAVTRFVFQESGFSYFCTGTLLNDTDGSTQEPWVYGAAHCFTQQSVANTLTTFWFYEASSCGGSSLDSAARQVSGGATVAYADVNSDVLLIRLNNRPPTGTFFLGWDSASLASNTDIIVVHHPAGDVMKVSVGRSTGFGSSSLASGSFIRAGYTTGSTEGGSSGCGLLTLSDGQYFLRGGLLGGTASCSNSGAISNSGNSDVYSRFDLAFPQLRAFLAPSSTEPPSQIDYSGAWSNPGQDGWGLVVVRGASGSYGMYVYHYDQDRSPAWYLSSGALSGTRFSADLFAFNGPWFGDATFNPGLVSARDAGALSVTFGSATQATISFTIDGRTVNSSLTKLAF